MRPFAEYRGPLTVEEFLKFENASSRRHEFVAGRVYLMSGTTFRHNRIALNIVTRLRTIAGSGPCQAYAIDIKVRVPSDRIYYPDCLVTCGPHEGDELIAQAPCMIVEVTSRNTRRIDRGEKLDAYLAMPSLRGYMIAEHDRRHVTLYSRDQDDAWMRDEFVTTGSLRLPCLDADLSLDEIYDAAELPPLRVREDGIWEDDDGAELDPEDADDEEAWMY